VVGEFLGVVVVVVIGVGVDVVLTAGCCCIGDDELSMMEGVGLVIRSFPLDITSTPLFLIDSAPHNTDNDADDDDVDEDDDADESAKAKELERLIPTILGVIAVAVALVAEGGVELVALLLVGGVGDPNL